MARGSGLGSRSTEARPVDAKREQRARAILEEARLLFAEVGYAGFSVRALAKRMGVSQGQLQYYFTKKDALFEAMVSMIIENYEPLRVVAGYVDRSPEERLEGFVRYLIEDLKDPVTNVIFFELWSIGQRDTFAMRMVDQFYQRYVANFDQMIEAINPRLDAGRRGNRAALAATQIEGLMVMLASGRPAHGYLSGVEQACVDQILHMAKQP